MTVPSERPRAPALLVAGIVVGAVIGAVAMLMTRTATPRDDSAEAGFARDMATHHAQAVEMSFVIRDKTPDERLRTLAYDIIVTQSAQRGVFMGWLQEWRLPQASARPRMAWMPGHAFLEGAPGGGISRMHGMATDDELRRLREAQARDAEILFLQLMIRHHEGGVIMARAVDGLTRRAEVVGMARSIESGQRAEIATMTGMLAERASAKPARDRSTSRTRSSLRCRAAASSRCCSRQRR
jgi:uncharacterized protein (DUF305 family)